MYARFRSLVAPLQRRVVILTTQDRSTIASQDDHPLTITTQCGYNVVKAIKMTTHVGASVAFQDDHRPLTSPAFSFAVGLVVTPQATDPLPITAILAGCPHTVAERADWPRRGSYANHAAQFPELSPKVA